MATVITGSCIVLSQISVRLQLRIGSELVCSLDVSSTGDHFPGEPPFDNDRDVFHCVEGGCVISVMDCDGLRKADLGSEKYK